MALLNHVYHLVESKLFRFVKLWLQLPLSLLEGKLRVEDALCKEQQKRKEVASKVEELTELVLTRDESISQLKIEAEKSLADLKHLQDTSIAEANSRNSETNKLKQEVTNKVRNNIFSNQNVK